MCKCQVSLEHHPLLRLTLLPLFESPLHTAIGGAPSSQLLSCKGSLVIFPSLLSPLICLESTFLTCRWLISVLPSQVEWTFSLEWTSSSRSCFMGAPTAFETEFRWVLSGSSRQGTHGADTFSCNNLPRRTFNGGTCCCATLQCQPPLQL